MFKWVTVSQSFYNIRTEKDRKNIKIYWCKYQGGGSQHIKDASPSGLRCCLKLFLVVGLVDRKDLFVHPERIYPIVTGMLDHTQR